MNDTHECTVFELRRYTLRPGQRDTLIDLFEREFIETQEAVGLRVLGQFRDLDAPDRFVWLRGFADMAARRRGLEAFYGGPAWAAHRNAANATMIDSDDVFLLRPAWPGAASALLAGRHAPHALRGEAPGFVDITVFSLLDQAGADLLAWCRDAMSPALARGGALRQAWFVSEPGANNFPRLPVREGEPVLVGVALFATTADFESFQHNGRWAAEVAPKLARWLACAPQSHRLSPTARSALHA